ncbi:hypothetical protein OVA03_05520 [Asticcacaulis sp. SL142]|uniref:hypothetical protein n=1 Tax=Asticcacaulis sp. SL142 TaxID=2995155 RepID=UPI00226D0317|nr:hypothetical protein [Asticcacaulis sp. SL142]WAC49367.1 hypothetical protein OVA03_05520 [Asticcacaulis sp. SL142]
MVRDDIHRMLHLRSSLSDRAESTYSTAAMGFTPQEVNGMSLYEFEQAKIGFLKTLPKSEKDKKAKTLTKDQVIEKLKAAGEYYEGMFD